MAFDASDWVTAADVAKPEAKAAQSTADAAKATADATAQHFWVDEDGAHISNTGDHDLTGLNLLLASAKLAFRKALAELLTIDAVNGVISFLGGLVTIRGVEWHRAGADYQGVGMHGTGDGVEISCDSSWGGEPASVAAQKTSASGEAGGCVSLEGQWLFAKDPSLAADGADVHMSALHALLVGMDTRIVAGDSPLALNARLASLLSDTMLYNGYANGANLDYDTAPGAGTTATVPLSEDVSHFKELTIVYRAALAAGPKGGNKSVTVPVYPGAYAQLDCVKWDNDGRDVCQFTSASYLLSGTSLSYASRVYGQIYTGSNAGTFGGTDSGQPCIIRVTGRR